MTAAYWTTSTPAPLATGDVCPRGRAFGLVGAGAMQMAQRLHGRHTGQWAGPSIKVKSNALAFAASHYLGADP